MLRFGPDTGPIAIMALPLFEEANRTRAFAVAICRALAVRGVASVLPDLPGQGESLVPLESIDLTILRGAHHDLVDGLPNGSRHSYALGIRSGALLDSDSHVAGRWYFAPQSGAALLRDLTRTRQSALGRGARLLDHWHLAEEHSVDIAGNVIGPVLLAGLPDDDRRTSGPRRDVRLATDAAAADLKVDGAPLWRRSEPANDLVLAQLLADDIADWIASCES